MVNMMPILNKIFRRRFSFLSGVVSLRIIYLITNRAKGIKLIGY